MNVSKLLYKSGRSLKKAMPTILTIVSAAGVVWTVIEASNAGAKAKELLDNAAEEKGEDLTLKEKVKVAAPVYAKTAVAAGATIASVVGSNVLNKQQQAEIMSAYTLVTKQFKDYKKKVEKVVDEETKKRIKEEVVKDKIDEDKPPFEEIPYGQQIFFDEYSEQFFISTIDQVEDAAEQLNNMLMRKGFATLWDYYDLLNIRKDTMFKGCWWSEEYVQAHGFNKIVFNYEPMDEVYDSSNACANNCWVISMELCPETYSGV
ncbi:MAG: DUF6353 family protein [Hungatella sp.]|jgi:hypothetical protein|nr:DUF6353 family protein [Hungatella sp.]